MSLLITISLFSVILLWYGKMFYLTSTTDDSFNFIIENKTQLAKHLLFILTIFVIISYIFLIRLNNVGRVINVPILIEIFWTIISDLSYLEIGFLTLVLLCLILFWVLFIKLVYQYIKSSLLTLFIYGYQYDYFRRLSGSYIGFLSSKHIYVTRRVLLFTKNKRIVNISGMLWPGLWNIFEPKIFKLILPYLCIFDYCCYQGNISRIFILLPWFYIYALLRSLQHLFQTFFTLDNMDFSEAVYKSCTINGKIHRWVVRPEDTIEHDLDEHIENYNRAEYEEANKNDT